MTIGTLSYAVRRAIASVVVGLAVTACDGGDGGSADDGAGDSTDGGTDGGAPVLADILVDVDYAGAMPGQLTVGAFKVCPPEIAPVAYARIDSPTYPAQATLRNLEPGTFCIVGFIDLEPLNPTFPGPEDPYGEQLGVVVDGQDVSASLTIVDP